MNPYLDRPTGSLNNSSVKEGYQLALSRQRSRGLASLTHGNKTLVFRTNPNSIVWSYKLNTAVENTYGGRVIQLLSTRMEDLRVTIECGLGGWNYAMKVAQFMRDMMIDQRNGEPGTFQYTTRDWNLKVYATSIPFQDRITETTREINLTFKIQEDISKTITKQTLRAEIAKLRDGIGFERTQFNTGSGVLGDGTTAPTILSAPNIVEALTTAEIPAIDPFASRNLEQNIFGSFNPGSITRIANLFGR